MNPRLFYKKAVGRVSRRLVTIPEQPFIENMKNGLKFEHRHLPFLDDGDLRAMLTKSYDILLVDCLRRNLHPGDIVLDVGGNVGYISAVAASCVGTSGEVHTFEPLKECFDRLEVLRGLNPQFRMHFNNVALGAETGTLSLAFDAAGDSRNATLVPGKNFPEAWQVPVWRLDEYIAERIANPDRIRFVKIDVEDFEFAVLRGLDRFFASTKSRPILVIEIKPWEIKKLGFTMQDFAD